MKNDAAPNSLIVATRNRHKTREIQEILGPEFAVQDLSDRDDIPETPETGQTFEENAILKAVAVSRCVPGLVVADDSGLEVDVLNGAPGVFSARYAGTPGDDARNVAKLLRELAEADPRAQQRRARFRCVLAIACAGKLMKTFAGQVDGTIAGSQRGAAGFGYDPVFVPENFRQTFAELAPAMKNQLSHRARAMAAAAPFLRTVLRTS